MKRTMMKLLGVGLLLGAMSGVAYGQPAPAPGEDRSMAFRPGVGDAQDRVPGGRLVLIAYTVVIGAIGLYATFVGRRAAQLEREVRSLEDALAKRGAKVGAMADFDDAEA